MMRARNRSFSRRAAILCASVLLWCVVPLRAAELEEVNDDHAFLRQLNDALAAYDIEVWVNLNDRELARSRPDRPRLGAFPDLPQNTYPDSVELSQWENAFATGQLSAVAVLAKENSIAYPEQDFLDRWLETTSPRRVLITFASADANTAETVARVARAYGYAVSLPQEGADIASVATLYATASHRFAIDSREARNTDLDVTEFSYLGERVRRGTNSLFREDGNRGNRRLARAEPAVFLKETLGDEFTQSTVREIIVPGGVALGETANLDSDISVMVFEQGRLMLQRADGSLVSLPESEPAELKALFDFVQRSESIKSDAIVDIDEKGRVKISSALRDTDVGYNIMHGDTLPFSYVSNLNVTKSVVLDTAVDWFQLKTGELSFETEFEVRFLSADNMRVAQTRVALEYDYNARSREPRFLDSWGRDTRRLRENLDYSGLGNDMAKIAHYAGWAALFRKMEEDQVPFLRGRYEFMKIDKSGKETPSRY